MEDQLIGVSMLAVSTAVFLYYSIWVLVLVRASRRAPSA